MGMTKYGLTKEDVLKATNDGLDILEKLYPEGRQKGKRFPKFTLSFREERTPSACFFRNRNTGIYWVKDFGGEAFDPISLVMKEKKLSFYEALQWIANEFGIKKGDSSVRKFDCKIEFILAEDYQQDDQYFFDRIETCSKAQLKVLGPLVNNDTLKRCGVTALKSFTQIKQYPANYSKVPERAGKKFQIIYYSREDYPIFLIEDSGAQKIYEPLKKDKNFRFRHVPGKKPVDLLMGLSRLEKNYKERKHNSDKDNEGADKNGEEKDYRLDRIIIASGDRDAMNVSSLGYPVVWKNSESEPLSWQNYERLRTISKEIINIPDIDETGYKMGVRLALKFIDIKTLWLPKWIAESNYRGKPRKDFTDLCKAVCRDDDNIDEAKSLTGLVGALVKTSLPARFWNSYTDKDGILKYAFNSEACFWFLNYNGYYTYKDDYMKVPYSFVHVKDNIVRKVDVTEVKNFPGDWVREKHKGIKLLNFIHDTTKLNDVKLSKLQRFKGEFEQTGANFQRLFFADEYWEVTKDGVSCGRYNNLDSNVWDYKLLDCQPVLNDEKCFSIRKDGTSWDIDVLRNDNLFFNFLINTSRVHWKETGLYPFKAEIQRCSTQSERDKVIRRYQQYKLEHKFDLTEAGLSEGRINEQKLHLINKIFAIGYLLHNYKREDRPWAVLAMDHRISDTSESNGGSGKSLVFAKAIPEMLQAYKYIAANDRKVYTDKHMLGNVTPDTDYILFDDADSHFPMRDIFTLVSGEMSIRSVYQNSRTIKFTDSPKVAFTSNFGIWGNDGSTNRRLLYCDFSDYYHYHLDEYFETWTVRDDFGKNLFSEFTEKEYSDWVNFMVECLVFYLGCKDKIDPPMDHINKRNQKQSMGDDFFEWANLYFNEPETNRINSPIYRTEIYRLYNSLQEKARNKLTPQRFKKKIELWCEYYGYVFNPTDFLTKDGEVPRGKWDGMTSQMWLIRDKEGRGAARMTEDKTGDSEDVDEDELFGF